MLLSFNCPRCSRELKVKPEQAGQKARCPSCKNVIVVPGKESEEPPPELTVTPQVEPTVVPERAPPPRSTVKKKPRDEPEEEEEDVLEEAERDRKPERKPEIRERSEGVRSRWSMARIGVVLAQWAMGLYCLIWGANLLNQFCFFYSVNMAGANALQLAGRIQALVAIFVVVLFFLLQLLSLIGYALTLNSPARQGAKPLAILSFCFSVTGCILVFTILFRIGLTTYGAPPLDDTKVVVLLLLFFLFEVARNTCFAFHLKAVAGALREGQLASRATLLGIMTPVTIFAVVLLFGCMGALISGADLRTAVTIVLLGRLVVAVALFALSWSYFKVAMRVSDAMQAAT